MEETLQWIHDFFNENQHLLRIIAYIVGAFVLWWVLRVLMRKGVDRFVYGVKKRQQTDSTQEILTSGLIRKRAIQRTRALGAISRSIITWVIFPLCLILVLREMGVNISALLTSFGFIGAGLAFGAQNIVKDVLNGLFIVLEDQLGVGDYVTIDNIEGTVEDVGIRITQVRGIDGTLWFVRNGEILSLGNKSQGFSEAIIDIVVDPRQDMDLVQQVMLESAQKVIESADYRRKITGTPNMLGLQNIYSDRATVRFTVRTRPEAHWSVQRAMRRQILQDFETKGIQLAKQLPDLPVN